MLTWENLKVEMSEKQAYIGQGENIGLSIITRNDNGKSVMETLANSAFAWSSTNEDVATVSSTGIVTGKSERIHNNCCQT